MTPPREVTPSIVLAFVAQLVEAHASGRVSTQHLALAELLRVARSLPALSAYVPAAPCDEIKRQVGDAAYVIRHVDGAVTETVLDPHGDDTVTAYTPEQARQKARDIESVVQAMEARS